MQGEPWRAIDGNLSRAIDTVFEFGLADPRGCDYRHVKVREAGELKEARAWVLPEDDDHEGQFAIGWSGLIYRVENIGAVADLEADMKLLAEDGTFQKEDPANLHADYRIDYLFSCYRRDPRISSAWAAPFLWTRLGHAMSDIGWKDASANGFRDVNPNPSPDEDPFGSKAATAVARQWEWDEIDWQQEWALLNRADAYAAFIEGEWSICVARANTFERAWKRAGDLIVLNNKDLPPRDPDVVDDPFGGGGRDDGWRDPLVQLPGGFAEMVMDARRRIGAQLQPIDVETATLDQLIEAWDQIAEFDLEKPPESFQKVVERGFEAIPALLQRVREDARFTRILYRSESGYNARLLPARYLSILAIERILEFPVLAPAESPYGWEPDAEQHIKQAELIEKFCQRYPNLRGAKLWHRVLADSDAGIEQRWSAAVALTSPIESDWIRMPD